MAPENEQPEGDQTDIDDFMAEHYAILEEAEREMKDQADLQREALD